MSLLGLISSFATISRVYIRKADNKTTKKVDTERVDPQDEPVTIVQKFINYYYDDELIKAYGLLTKAEQQSVGDDINLSKYTTFTNETPSKIMLNNREYANGTHSIKAYLYFAKETLIKDFGVIIEDKSWKIDYIKNIKNYSDTPATDKWIKYKVGELTLKYPNTWQLVANSKTQIALKPKDNQSNSVKIQIDVQKGLKLNDVLFYVNCTKIKNSECFEADIKEQEFNEVDSINGDTSSNFLVTEKDGTVYVTSITYPLTLDDTVKNEIEAIISTFTF